MSKRQKSGYLSGLTFRVHEGVAAAVATEKVLGKNGATLPSKGPVQYMLVEDGTVLTPALLARLQRVAQNLEVTVVDRKWLYAKDHGRKAVPLSVVSEQQQQLLQQQQQQQQLQQQAAQAAAAVQSLPPHADESEPDSDSPQPRVHLSDVPCARCSLPLPLTAIDVCPRCLASSKEPDITRALHLRYMQTPLCNPGLVEAFREVREPAVVVF